MEQTYQRSLSQYITKNIPFQEIYFEDKDFITLKTKKGKDRTPVEVLE